MALTERLELDLNDALRGVSRLDDSLEQMTRRFRSDLASALDVLSGIRVEVDASDVTRSLDQAVQAADLEPEIDADADLVTSAIDEAIQEADLEPEIDADATPVTEAIDEAVEGADREAEIEGEASAVVDSIETAIDEADTEVPLEGDGEPISQAIDDAITGADTEVPLTADGSEISTAIDEGISSADTEVPLTADVEDIGEAIEQAIESADSTVDVDADTSQAEAAIEDLASTASEAAGGGLSRLEDVTGRAGGAANLAAGSFSGLGAAIGAEEGRVGAAAAGIAAVAVAAGHFFNNALEAETAERRFGRSLGDLAEQVQRIDVGGLNEDISQLAVRTGNADEPLLLAAARVADLGQSAGASAPRIAQTTEGLIALAVRATTLNPTLGEAGQVADAMGNAFARGGRALAPFGIALSAAEIQARALADTGKTTADQLTIFDKTAAGVALTTERLGNTLASSLNEAALGSEVRLRSLRVSLDEAAEAFGRPIVEPTILAFQQAQPILLEVGQAFGELAQVALPVLIQALSAVQPAVGASGDILRALFEVLGPLLSLIEAMPDPVLAGAGSFLVFGRALSGLTDFLSGSSIPRVAAFGGALTAVSPILVALGAVTIGVTSAIQANSEAKRQAAAAATALGTALLSETTARQQTLETTVQETITSRGLGDELRRLGLSYADLAGFASGNVEAGRRVAEAFAAQRGESGQLSFNMAQLANVVGGLSTQFQAASQAALQDAIAKGQVSEAAVRTAESQNRLNDGTINYFAALQQVLPQQADLIAKHGDAATAAGQQAQEEDNLADKINRVIDATLELTNKELANERARLNLREATARLSEAEENLADRINTTGAESDETAEAQRRLDGAQLSQREAAIRAAQAQAALADQQITTTNTAERAQAQQANLRQAFLDVAGTLAPGSALRVYLEGLANRISTLPDRQVTITADASQAEAEADRIDSILYTATRPRTIPINSVASGPFIGAQSGGHFAAGTPLLVGEVGPELFIPNFPGTVVPSAQVEQALARVLSQQNVAFERLSGVLGGRGGGGGVSIGQLNVNEVVADARATAFAVTSTLGRLAER